MILVTDVKIVVTPNDPWKIMKDKRSPDDLCYLNGNDPIPALALYTELVKGKKFRNVNGVTVNIGWDKRTQTELGLPFEAFNRQEKRRESDYRENTRLRKELRELKEMTFLAKLKFLFFS